MRSKGVGILCTVRDVRLTAGMIDEKRMPRYTKIQCCAAWGGGDGTTKT